MASKNLKDLSFFSEFAKSHYEDYKAGRKFVTYYFGKIYSAVTEEENNKHKINLYVLNAVLNDKVHYGDYKIESVGVNWSDFKNMEIGCFIEPNGTLKQLDGKDRFFDETLSIDDVEDHEQLTLQEVRERYSFLNKAHDDEDADEVFYVYKTNKGPLCLPAAEIVRFFYLYSKGDTLVKAILRPDGLPPFVRELKVFKKNKHGITHYELVLPHDGVSADAVKIFYFYHNENNLSLFHSVWQEYSKSGLLKAPIPCKGSLKLKIRYQLRKDALLGIRIYDSDIFKVLNQTSIDVYHANSQNPEEDDKNIRNPEYDTHKNIPNANDEVDSEKTHNSNTEKVNIKDDDLADENGKDIFRSELCKGPSVEYKRHGTRRKKGGKTIRHSMGTDAPTTSNPKGSGKGKATGQAMEGNNAEQPNKKVFLDYSEQKKMFHYVEMIIDIIITRSSDYGVIFRQTYEVRQNNCKRKRNIKGERTKEDICRKAEAFLDVDHGRNRSYLVVSLSNGKNRFTFVEMQNREIGEPKNILVLRWDEKHDNEAWESIIGDIVFDQVKYGHHPWLDEYSKEKLDFISIKRSISKEEAAKTVLGWCG